MAMKSKKLEKMRMPSKRQRDEELDMSSLSDEESDPMEDESMESPEHEGMEEDLGLETDPESVEQPSNPELERVSDEELMAEIQKRGLLSDMEESNSEEEPSSEGNPPEDDSQDMYS